MNNEKKKGGKLKWIVIVILVLIVIGALAGGNDKKEENISQSDERQGNQGTQTETQDEETQTSQETDDGIINFDGDGYNVTYVKHELSEDYEGNPCLLFYYTFTNTGEENASAAVHSYIKVFQNGVQCEPAIMMDSPDESSNYMKDVQPGYSIEVCQAFKLSDSTTVTVEASDLISFDNKKDVQTLVLE